VEKVKETELESVEAIAVFKIWKFLVEASKEKPAREVKEVGLENPMLWVKDLVHDLVPATL